jgi:hypothetical protein
MSVTRGRPLADLLQLFAGPVIWFAHFTVVYGAEALLCTPPASSPRIMIWLGAAATIAALAALAAFAAALVRRPAAEPVDQHTGAAFLHRAALLLALLSAIAVIWVFFPIAVLRACTTAAG